MRPFDHKMENRHHIGPQRIVEKEKFQENDGTEDEKPSLSMEKVKKAFYSNDEEEGDRKNKRKKMPPLDENVVCAVEHP